MISKTDTLKYLNIILQKHPGREANTRAIGRTSKKNLSDKETHHIPVL